MPNMPNMPNMPRPMPFPGVGQVRPAIDDCAITAMNVAVQARRSAAIVDVGVRVRGVKGGACRIVPAPIQLTTGRGTAVGRPLSVRFIDGQVQRPINMTEGAGGEQLAPWITMLRANEEKQVTLRYYVEGLPLDETGVEPAGRLTVPLRDLGARVYAGAPLTVKVSVDPASKARVQVSTGNPKAPPAPRSTDASGSATFSTALSRDDLTPQVEWRFEGELPPPADATQLATGLPVFEYLRSGLVQDLAAGLTADAGKKDDKKADDKKDDKKKDEKAASPAEAAWDRALDVSVAAARSNDPVVAGMGVRALAWLASGLAAAPVKVHAPGAAASPDSVEVPEKVATLVSKAADGFLAATGQKSAPSMGNSPLVRAAVAKLGEPGSRKKEADEAMGRLVKRLDENKTLTVGNFFSTAPAAAVPFGVKVPGARLIGWNKQRMPYYVASGPVTAPRAPFVQRVVHGMSHLRGLVKFLLFVTIVGGLIVAAWWYYWGRRVAEMNKPQTA